MGQDGLLVVPFHPSDQEEVKSLILAGLAEHWGTLDAAKNLDLNDISASYSSATFLVAHLDGSIVGTGALVKRNGDEAEIVRMSVDSSRRRQGIGRTLLNALRQVALDAGYRRLTLETTETWSEAIAFYLDYGFRITHNRDGDVYFELDLRAPTVCRDVP